MNDATRQLRWGVLAVSGLLLLAFLATPAAAQTKIAVIDVERILTDSQVGKSAVAELTSMRDAKQTEIDERTKEVEAKQAELAESRLSLSESKLVEMEQELEDLAIAARRLAQTAQEEMQQTQAQKFGKIEQDVVPIIAALGKEYGYTAIFNKFQGGLLWADEAVDITNLVIERFDAAAPAEN